MCRLASMAGFREGVVGPGILVGQFQLDQLFAEPFSELRRKNPLDGGVLAGYFRWARKFCLLSRIEIWVRTCGHRRSLA